MEVAGVAVKGVDITVSFYFSERTHVV